MREGDEIKIELEIKNVKQIGGHPKLNPTSWKLHRPLFPLYIFSNIFSPNGILPNNPFKHLKFL